MECSRKGKRGRTRGRHGLTGSGVATSDRGGKYLSISTTRNRREGDITGYKSTNRRRPNQPKQEVY